MSIFGQVWLWSITAFLVGMLLTWLMLVRPVQARNRVLQRRLRAALASRPPEPRAEPPARFFQPPEERGLESYPPLEEPDFFAGQPKPESDPPSPPLAETEFLAGRPEPESPGQLRRDSESLQNFLSEPEPATESAKPAWFRNASDAPAEEDRTKPAEPPAPDGLGLSSVLEPERELETELTSVFKLTDEKPVQKLTEQKPVEKLADQKPIEDKGSERGTLFDPGGPAPAGLPGLSGPDALPAPPAYAFGGGPAPGSSDESAIETTQVLPQRQPRQAATNDGSAQPAPPSIRPIERREPVQPDEGGRSGSLFEPAVRRGSPATAGDPMSTRAQPASAVPAGPFGPGSATPRPGGGRPSEEFAVKASVAALRYCTEDSPQYQRMVAEVWFRTPADAEKVGFRPIS